MLMRHIREEKEREEEERKKNAWRKEAVALPGLGLSVPLKNTEEAHKYFPSILLSFWSIPFLFPFYFELSSFV